MIRLIKCWLFGHPDTQETDVTYCIKEKCVRCGMTINERKEYRHRAKDYLHHTRRPTVWEPVEEITDADGRVLQPGDSIGYMGQSAFPGLKWEKSGVVQFIYEDSRGERHFALKHRDKVLRERDIIGYRPREKERAVPNTLD